MKNLSRREFVAGMAAAGLFGGHLIESMAKLKKDVPGIRVGVCDWSLGGKDPQALDVARSIQLDGVEISPVKPEDRLSYADPKIQKQYKAKASQTGVAIASLALTISNKCPLATDPRGPAWLEQTIDATAALGARCILLAFFGKGNLIQNNQLSDDLVSKLADRLKAAAARAKEKGVILGLENTLSAKQNIRIMEAVGHDSVQVYYDIANSTKNGYDVPAEIQLLGDRICQFHFKDNKGSFNSGNPEMGPIVEAVKAINYKGWIILERSFGKDKEAYFQNNGQFVRKVFGLQKPTYS